MYFRAEESEYGTYVSKNGMRFDMLQCKRVRPSTGWTVFDSLDECLAEWKLIYAPSRPTEHQ